MHTSLFGNLHITAVVASCCQRERAESLILVPLLLLHAGSMGLVNQASKRWAVMMTGEKTWWNKPGYHLSYMEDYPPYPYQRIKSEDGKDTGVVALIAPFYDLTYYRVCVMHFACASSSLLLDALRFLAAAHVVMPARACVTQPEERLPYMCCHMQNIYSEDC